jgi:hypothetical protein
MSIRNDAQVCFLRKIPVRAGDDGPAAREAKGDDMKPGQTGVKKLARLLETAAKKHNESADATCSVAVCFDCSDGGLSDEMFDSVFEKVTELARVSLDRKPDYERAARELIAKLAQRAARAASRKRTSRK